uniref:FAM193 C-terminal domain-containing protein n=1 Tax=Anolis carolinensis TaxID=28377 RepID=G1KA90_ANOCA
SEDTCRALSEQYHQLEQAMGQVAEAWLECQKRIDDYVDEEVAMRTKQRFLKEDWEVFKQRHFIDQLNGGKAVSGENNFTDTMRHLLSSQLNISDCPNCNYRHRCTCDDCSLSHILMCGIMDSPVTEDIHNNHLPLQIDSAPDCLSESHLSSMSSGSSGSSSGSPFTVQQRERLKPILNENSSGPSFNTENEDIEPVSEKPENLCSCNHCDIADIDSASGIHRQLNDCVKSTTLKLKSPHDSSTSSTSSEGEAEKPSAKTSSHLPRIQKGDLMIGSKGTRKDGSKRNSPVPSYPTQQTNQVSTCCECHICKQETIGLSSSDTEQKCLPAGHQFKIPEKTVHPGLHLYPHIHGQMPLPTVPHLSPTLHTSFYTAPPLAQNKALLQNHTNNQPMLNTSFQDHIYSNGFGSTTDWKSSEFLSIWESEVMNEKNWYASNFLQDELPGEGNVMVASSAAEPNPNILPVTTGNEGMAVTDSKKKENMLKKKCLYHFQDAFMHNNKVVMATSSFKVSSKRSSSLGDVFHSISSEDHRCSASATPQNSSTTLAPLSSLSPGVLSPTSAPHLPGSGIPSFSRTSTTAPSFVDANLGLYPTTVASPSTKDSLVSTASSVCSDPDCEGQHCEHSDLYDHPQYDGEESQDEDSCSEHSSSTSTSTNQKEGKYCDCCYCEFFGHGGPPAAPTSRNYAEMREKLRLRLTKRKEGQPRKPELISDRDDVVDHRKVEDLLQFINSPETKPVSSTRIAKRARHKQKKLEENGSILWQTPSARERKGKKSQVGTESGTQQQRQQIEHQGDEAQQLQTIKKKKKRANTSCEKVKIVTQNCEAMRKPSSGASESLQSELLGKREIPSDSLSKHTDDVEQGPASENFCEPCDPTKDRDSQLLFKTEMTVKSHEPLSLLLNIMHNHTEDNSKEQITQISKLFAQQLKKPCKGTDSQPRIKNKMKSKLKVTDLQSHAASQKEEKKVSAKKSKQMNPVTKSSFVRTSFFPSEQLHNKQLLQDSSQPKVKSKKNKKKSDKGSSSIGKAQYVYYPVSFSVPIVFQIKNDVFLPKDVDLDSVEMDETEREVEYFKRFCLDSARQTRQRLSVNWSNFTLKKATFAAH